MDLQMDLLMLESLLYSYAPISWLNFNKQVWQSCFLLGATAELVDVQ